MKQKNYILPVQCKRCGALFDLWYDLHEETTKELDYRDVIRNFRESLCWKCRYKVVKSLYKNLKMEKQNEEHPDFMLVLDEE